MAIEKMTFIDMNGSSVYLDEVLIRCLDCGIFQPENANKLSEYSIGSTALLRNPYGGLLIKMTEIAGQLKINLEYSEFDRRSVYQPDQTQFMEDAHIYLNRMRKEYPVYFEKQYRLHDEIVSYTAALDMLGHIDAPDMNFDELWHNKYLKIRFGRMPSANFEKLSLDDKAPYQIHKLSTQLGYTWCLYVTADEYHDDIDEMFATLGFERLRIPDYVHGTTPDAITYVQQGLVAQRAQLEQSSRELDAYIARERTDFLAAYCSIKFLHDAYDLRKYVVSINDHFHLIGFVLQKDKDRFLQLFTDLPQVMVAATPAGDAKRLPVPVKLKNNWFVRPFEMFVNMYGSPSYNDIDPSPFVAYTYSFLFGMMFGDAGHGLCVFIIGLLLWRFKKMQLGQIMSRIGVSSMLFGTLYGSFFGVETALDWFYTGVLHLPGKPIEVMHPDTTNKILIATIGLGAVIIFMVIIFNIIIGIKHRDFDRAVLSHNGVAGLVLYTAVLLLVIKTFTHVEILTTTEEILLIALPLVIVFFREPITHFIKYKSTSDILKTDEVLVESTHFHDGSINIRELFASQFVVARFGRIPTDSYQKLTFYQNEPFMLYPVKSQHDYIWCIYAAAVPDKAEIDAIFQDLYFERLYIPQEDLVSNDLAEAYIKRCVDAGGSPDNKSIEGKKYGPVKIAKPKTTMQTIFPDGIGGFFTQTFFEMFEVILSFITNTMSFLRVGGFILVHAGMMAVVFTLAKLVGGGASPVILVIGNVFVMVLEGLIVGIQVLRLEFYEIFSRFFDANGKVFSPVQVIYSEN